jgi:indole-3-acetate monooxygenase
VEADDPVAAVATLTAAIREQCTDTDTTRALPPGVVQSLQDVGVFRLLAPAEIGGGETDPLTFLRLVEAASYADGSVGWCVMIGGCYAMFGGMLPPEGANAIYGDPHTISAGAFRPMGVARAVAGGYRVSGRWVLGSGSTHATWFVGGCMVQRDGEPVVLPSGAPLMRELFFPADVVQIIRTWDSTGLRGTASHDYAVEDVFVPDENTCWFQDPPAVDRPLYVMPPIAVFATFIAAVPLGIARHAIDEFVQLAGAKTPAAPGVPGLADRAVVQDKLGRADVAVAAARAHLIAELGDLWARVGVGHAPTLADRGRLWTAATHAAHTAVDAIEALYASAGSSSVYATCALDRCLRDALTAAQHVTTQELNFEMAGRQLLGKPVIPGPWMLDFRGEGDPPQPA